MHEPRVWVWRVGDLPRGRVDHLALHVMSLHVHRVRMPCEVLRVLLLLLLLLRDKVY